METCGGARGDCDARRSAAEASAWNSRIRALRCRVNTDANIGCGCAESDVLTARQPSCLQQDVSRTARWSVAAKEPWHWWAAWRIQQACGGAAAAASPSGTKAPTMANNSKNLAVRRCMLFSKSRIQGGASIEQNLK